MKTIMEDGKTKMNQELNGSLLDFVQKNRTPFLVCIIAITVFSFGFVILMIVFDNLNKSAIVKLEDYLERYDEIIASDEFTALDNSDDKAGGKSVTEKHSDSAGQTASFIADFTNFAEKNSGYPAAEAWFTIAYLQARQAKWANSETAYLKAAAAGKKTYLAPMALLRAAIAAEEQGKIKEAVEHYSAAMAFSDFSEAVHAQFSIGRLYEEEEKINLAIEAYQAVIDDFPKNEDWTALAHSRIIALETKNKK
jgi:tetratricopeptide (TPR) repeat protein